MLQGLIESDMVCRVQRIYVQFHGFDYLRAHQQRCRLRQLLNRTHINDYDVPFVWESWVLRSWSAHCGANRFTRPHPATLAQRGTQSAVAATTHSERLDSAAAVAAVAHKHTFVVQTAEETPPLPVDCRLPAHAKWCKVPDSNPTQAPTIAASSRSPTPTPASSQSTTEVIWKANAHSGSTGDHRAAPSSRGNSNTASPTPTASMSTPGARPLRLEDMVAWVSYRFVLTVSSTKFVSPH